MQRLILLALGLFVFQVSADVPKVVVNQKGESVLTVLALDYFGERSYGVLVLKPDGRYTYDVQSWGCDKNQFSPLRKEWIAACGAK